MTQGIFKFCISCFVLIAFEMKEASIEGPIFRDQSDQFEKSKYIRKNLEVIGRWTPSVYYNPKRMCSL